MLTKKFTKLFISITSPGFNDINLFLTSSKDKVLWQEAWIVVKIILLLFFSFDSLDKVSKRFDVINLLGEILS